MQRFGTILVAATLAAVVAVPVERAFAGGKGGKGGGGISGGRSASRSSGGSFHGGSFNGSSFKSSGRSIPGGGFSSKAKGSQGNASNRTGKAPIQVGGSAEKVRRPQIGDAVKKPVDGIKRQPITDVVKKPQPFPKPLPKPFPKPIDPPHNGHAGNGHGHHDGHGHHGHHDHHHHGFCFTLPLLPCPPVIREEVVVVEQVVVPAAPQAPAAPTASEPATDAAADEASKQAAADAAEKALDKAQAADKLPAVPVGSTLTLEGQNLGEKQGKVSLQIGRLSLPTTMVRWDGKSTTITLPEVGLSEATTAQIHVFTAESKLVSSLAVQLVPESAADAATKAAPQDATSAPAQSAGDPAVGQSQVANN